MENTSGTAAPRMSRATWASHVAVWILAGLAARLSRTGSMLELHTTGRNGAELTPEHVRQILTAPTTEFKAISLIGVLAALGSSPRDLDGESAPATVVHPRAHCRLSARLRGWLRRWLNLSHSARAARVDSSGPQST